MTRPPKRPPPSTGPAAAASTSDSGSSSATTTLCCSQCNLHLPLGHFYLRKASLLPFHVCKVHKWYWTPHKRAATTAPEHASTLGEVADQLKKDGLPTAKLGFAWVLDGEEDLKDRVVKVVRQAARAVSVKPLRPRQLSSSLPNPAPTTQHFILTCPSSSSSSEQVLLRLALTYNTSVSKFAICLTPEAATSSTKKSAARPRSLSPPPVPPLPLAVVHRDPPPARPPPKRPAPPPPLPSPKRARITATHPLPSSHPTSINPFALPSTHHPHHHHPVAPVPPQGPLAPLSLAELLASPFLGSPPLPTRKRTLKFAPLQGSTNHASSHPGDGDDDYVSDSDEPSSEEESSEYSEDDEEEEEDLLPEEDEEEEEESSEEESSDEEDEEEGDVWLTGFVKEHLIGGALDDDVDELASDSEA